jgi:hypothetical protein
MKIYLLYIIMMSFVIILILTIYFIMIENFIFLLLITITFSSLYFLNLVTFTLDLLSLILKTYHIDLGLRMILIH